MNFLQQIEQQSCGMPHVVYSWFNSGNHDRSRAYLSAMNISTYGMPSQDTHPSIHWPPSFISFCVPCEKTYCIRDRLYSDNNTPFPILCFLFFLRCHTERKASATPQLFFHNIHNGKELLPIFLLTTIYFYVYEWKVFFLSLFFFFIFLRVRGNVRFFIRRIRRQCVILPA